jgi:hypothetical protein
MVDDTPEQSAASTKPAPRRRSARTAPAKQESGASKDEVPAVATEATKPAPVKRARKPAASRASAAAPAPASSQAPTPKPRSSKRAVPRPSRRAKETVLSPGAKPADTARTDWGKAAMAGGLAALGALATAALLSLRGSSSAAAGPNERRQDGSTTRDRSA